MSKKGGAICLVAAVLVVPLVIGCVEQGAVATNGDISPQQRVGLPVVEESQKMQGQTGATDFPPFIILFFSDGMRSHYDIVRPLLNSFGFKGTFAVPCCSVNVPGNMSIGELQVLAKDGHEISAHGWTHAYDAEIQGLTVDAPAGSTTLTLDTVSGLGTVKETFTTKTRISDDAHPSGEYVEIKELKGQVAVLASKLVGSYAVANNAKLEMDEECIKTHFDRMQNWWRTNQIAVVPRTVGVWGALSVHKPVWYKYITRDYIALGWAREAWMGAANDYKEVFDSVLRYPSEGGLEVWNIGDSPASTTNAIIAARARPGYLTSLAYHDIVPSNPGKSNDLAEFIASLALIKKLGCRVITLADAAEVIKQHSSKDVALCFYEDSIAGGATSTLGDCIGIDLTGYSDLALTVSADYHALATAGIKVHVYTSYDGSTYDTEEQKDNGGAPVFGSVPCSPNTFQQITKDVAIGARFVKVTIENLDAVNPVRNVKVIAPVRRRVDTTPPTTPLVTGDAEYTTSLSQLHASWVSSDNESGIIEYQYAIGTSPGGTDVLDWTPVSTTTKVTYISPSLTVGTTYYVCVKAKNGHGVWSEVGKSDGIKVLTKEPSYRGDNQILALPFWIWVVAGVLIVVILSIVVWHRLARRQV